MFEEARRQHPVAAITQLLQLIRQNWITILVLLFVGSGKESIISPYFMIGLFVVGIVGGVVSWVRFTYQVVDGELQIKQGIFVHKNLYLSKDRIQVIDISAGVVQRVFGLVSVEVKTAGGTSKEAKIDAITRFEAEHLKELLRTTNQQEEDVDQENPEKVYQLSMKELIITASTSGNFGVALSIVGGIFSQVDQIIDEQQMINFIGSIIPASLAVSLILSTIVLILLTSWLLSFLGTLIKYYDFTLVVEDDELLIRRGLLEQKQLTIPFNRIQALQIKEELLRQPFGYASIILESAGYGEEQLNSTTLFPLIKRSNIDTFIQQVVPEYHSRPVSTGPPPIALRRYLLRMVWVSLVIIIPAWLWIPYGSYSWFLLIPALILGFAQYRDAKIGVSDGNTLLLQSRLLSRTTAVVKKYRAQSVFTKQNPFQRRLGLVSYGVTVTSGSSGQTFAIRDLNEGEGDRFLRWIAHQPLANGNENRKESKEITDD